MNDPQEAPFQPPAMPATPESGKMLSIFLSDYVVNSLGYVLQNHHMMQHHLTSKDVRILKVTQLLFHKPHFTPNTCMRHAVILNSEVFIKPAMYHFRSHVH